MDDLISRQWLMECVNEGWIKFDTEKDANTYIHLVRDIAPSAQPERIRGRWECWPGQLVPHNTIWWYVCSACGGKAIDGGVLTKFCPNCGADMREWDEQKSDDGI